MLRILCPAISVAVLSGCALTSYREDRDAWLREVRETGIGARPIDNTASTVLPRASPEDDASLEREGVTLEDALAYALGHNPELAFALSRWEMLLGRVPQASSLDDPTLQYVEYLRSVQTRAGPMERSVTLTQRLPWPGKLGLRGEMALADARRGEEEYREDVLRTLEAVERAWSELALAYRLIELNEDLKRIMRTFVEVVRKKLEAGLAVQPDVLRAQIELTHLEHQGIVLERDRRIALERLNALLNRPPRAPVGRPEALPEPAFAPALNELLATALAASPAVRRAEHAVARSLAQRSLASLAYVPDLTVGASYTQIGGGTNPGFRKDGDDAFALVFGVNIPIQLARRRGAVAESEAAIRMARAAATAARRRVSSDVTTAHERLVAHEREAHLLRETLLPRSEHHLAAAQKAYEAGELDFLSLLDAERNIDGIRRDHSRATAEFHKALAGMRRAAGGKLP